jgi:hypothetical protein
MKLVKFNTSENEPRRILCYDENEQCIGKIYCDQTFIFDEIDVREISVREIEQMVLIAKNFNLFYENI